MREGGGKRLVGSGDNKGIIPGGGRREKSRGCFFGGGGDPNTPFL